MSRPIRQQIAILAGLLVALLATTVPEPAVSVHAGDSKVIYLDNGNPLPTGYNGSSALVQALTSSSTVPVSMASDDFDHDGVADLAIGYSTPAGPAIVLRRGNLDAFAPRDQASFEAIRTSQFPSPFLSGAGVAAVADRPDFLAAGRFEDGAESDLIMASRGGHVIDVLRGDGQMGFQPGQTITTPGTISALRVLRRDAIATHSQVFVGVRTDAGAQVLIYVGSANGLTLSQTITLASDAVDFQFGELDGDSFPDALVVSGGAISILHGRNLQSGESRVTPDPIPVSFEVSAAALGIFVHSQDAHTQIALLSTDGTVHLLASDGTGNAARSPAARTHQSEQGPLAWTEIESFPGVAPANPAAPPLFFRTRISSNNSDDVMILNAAGGQTAVISHPNPAVAASGAATFPPGIVLTRSDSSAGASAALDMRVNIDGRPGVAFLTPAQIPVSVMMPLPDPVFVVNTTVDSVDVNPADGACSDANGRCSLRAAIMQANNDSGNDTIMVPAGTYTLTLTGPNKETGGETDAYGSLDIFHGVSIVGQTDGSGNPATIIQAGASATTGIDKVFAINPNSASAFDTSFSNLQIQFGRNPGTYSGGLVMPHGFGGGLSWEGNLTGNLSLTNCVITDNSTLDGDGGGIALDSGGTLGRFDGTGVVTISNSIVRRNSANESSTGGSGNGGGIWAKAGTALVLTNSQIVNNTATQFAGGGGRGGGIFVGTPGNTHTQVDIVGGVISGNQATGGGAGIYTGQGIRIEQGTVITNNSGAAQGGGLWTTSNGQITTLSRVTIAGNSATSQGGGIFSGTTGSSNQLFITFSRIANNSAPIGSNLSAWVGTIDATLNWWGTNTPAPTIDGVATFDPFIVLTNTANPAKILIHQTSTLTASFLQENHGNPISPVDLGTLISLPVNFSNPALGTISQPQPESIDSTGTATATFVAGGVGGQGHVDAVVDNAVVTAGIIVLQPPSITEAIAPASVLPNTPSTVTLTITNGNTVTINANFADLLPAGLLIAPAPGLISSCGGTLTAAAGSSSMNFANPALPPGMCSINVNVASAVDGIYNNSVTIGSADAAAGNTATAQLTVISPPSIAKSFGAASAPLNAPVSLNFAISNPNVNLGVTGVAFNDVLPAGMTVATTHRVNNTCGGALSALDGAGIVSLSGASIAAGASCAVSVDVIGTTAGIKNNSVTVSSTNGGAGSTSAASLLAIAPPALQQSFSAPTVALGSALNLSFTLTNPNASATLTGIGFADSLPAGLVISTPNGLSNSCSGTLTAVAGTNVINLSGAVLSPGASCAISLSVTGAAAGDQHNTAGPAGSNEGGAGAAVSSITSVVAPASIAATFTPAAIGLNTTSTLGFTMKNPAANTVALTGASFTVALPSGLTAANNSSAVCGGTLSVSGGNTIALSGATLAVNQSCQFNVSVTGAQTGSYAVSTSAVLSANGGSGNTASANLIVAAPPAIAISFSVNAVALNQTAQLSFSITNPAANSLPLTGLAFSDAFPAGLAIGSPGLVSNTCGGAVTAATGSSAVSLTGGTLATGATCSIVVTVQGVSAGTKLNTTGAISSNESGAGAASNAASLVVVIAPTESMTFGAATIALNGSASLTFTIANPNTATGLANIGFTDTLPAALAIANGIAGSCATGGAGVDTPGSAAANPATNQITLQGLALSPGGTCSLIASVTGVNPGFPANVSGNVAGAFDQGSGQFVVITGNAAAASLTVIAPPSINQTIGSSLIAPGASASLTISIANPAGNTVALTGVAFTDGLPSGLAIGAPSNLSNSCGGTIVAAPGSGSLALTSGSIAPGATCNIAVLITGTAAGDYSITTTPVTSTNGGAGNSASSHLSVKVADLTIAKSHAGSFTHGQSGATYSLVVANIGLGPTFGSVAVTDAMPLDLAPVAMAGSGWNCTLAALTCTRSDGLMPGASYPEIVVTVNVPYSGATSTINTATVVGGGELNVSNDSASDATVLNPGAPASISAFAGTPQTIVDSGSASPFQTLVSDPGGYGVPGVPVTFTATGGGVFADGGGSTTAITDARGFATSTVFVVPGAAGVYLVNATVPGVPKTVAFSVAMLNTNLTVSPLALSYQYNAGDPLPPSAQTISVGADIPFTATVSVTPSAGWLAATLGTSGPLTATANVSVNPAGLAAGAYVGSVLFNLGSRTITVGVTLTVVGQPTLVTSPPSLTFASVPGQGASQTLLLSSRYRNVGFSAASSVPWISVSANSSTTPATLTVTVDPAAASSAASRNSAGSVSGAVLVSAAGVTNSPLSIPVSFTVSFAPSISTGGFENAASYQSGQGAPNTIMVLFGTFPCQSTASVLVGGQSAEVISAFAGTVSFTLPGSVAGQTSASVQVGCNGQQSNSIDIPIVPASPGLFTLSMTGTGQSAALNGDLSVNGPSNPAAPGGYLAIYGTGFGTYTTREDGLDWLNANVQAFVGDKPATVEFAGHAPDLTRGLQQLNILIPPDAPTGPAVPIKFIVNGVATQSGVTVAIQ